MPTVVVTGTSSGFGRAIAVLQARRGWQVIATVLPGDSTTGLRADLLADGTLELVDIVELDITDHERVASVLGEALAKHGGCDALVNNAGVRVAGPFEETPDDAIRSGFAVNTFGTFEVTRAVLPTMRANGAGRILTISSVGALAGIPGLSTYVASKAAVEGWAESLAYEVAPFGIDIGLIEPQSFKTNVWAAGSVHGEPAGPYADLLDRLAAGDEAAAERAAGPEQVAAVVADLLQLDRIPLRTPVGASARARGLARGVLPASAQRRIIGRLTGVAATPPPRVDAGDRRVLITGCSTGFGREFALEQARRGWSVYASMRSTQRSTPLLEAAAAEGLDDAIRVLELDVTDAVSVTQAAELIAGDGGLDALVNNAGVRLVGAFEELDAERIDAAFETNVFGTMRTTRAMLPLLRRSSGHIVTVTSSSSFSGLPTWSAYAATKFAVAGWADSLQYEVAPFGVHVSLIAPGAFRTEIWRDGTEVAVPDSPYSALTAHMAAADAKAAESGGDPKEVALALARTLEARRPLFVRPVGTGSWARWAVRGVVPDRLQQAAFGRLSGIDEVHGR